MHRTHPSKTRVTLAVARLGLLLVLLGFLADAALVQATLLRRSPSLFVDPTSVVHDTNLPLLGVTVELEQYATADERLAALRTLHDAHFRWVRQRFDWAQIEPRPGHFEWVQSDALLRDIAAADLVPLVVLDGSPAWARAPRDADNPLAPPRHPQDFAKFAAAFATRYRAEVKFYQLWDEPNIAPHWGNRRPDPVAYAQMLALASPALRAADDNVGGATTIVLAALAPTADRGHLALDEPYFLQRLYAAGAATHFDVVAVQPFGFGTRPDDVRLDRNVLNLRRVDLARQAMVAAGDGATPVWAVRYGWNRAPASASFGAPFRSVSAENQRAFATAALDFAAARPWLTAMGWTIDQPAAPPRHPLGNSLGNSLGDPRWGFALTDSLRAQFARWSPRAPTPPSHRLPVASLLPPLFFFAIALQRMHVAAHLLPWRRARHRYLAVPAWGRGLLWLALLFVYHLATWPPLIVACWGLAVLGIAAQPRVGLALAAAMLPFHLWHKELLLPGATLAVAPSHATLGCLAAVLLLRTRELKAAIYFCRGTSWRAPTKINPPHKIPSFLARLTKIRVYLRSSAVRFPRFPALDWLALAWLSIGLLGAINAPYAPAHRTGLLDFVLAPLALYGATRLLARTPEARRQIGAALLLGGVLAAAVGLWAWGRGGGEVVDGVRRLVGPHFSANHTALYLERTLFVGAGLWLAARGRRRWLVGGAVALVMVALGLTASRGALLLGVPVGCLLLMAWGERGKNLAKPFWRRRHAGLAPIPTEGVRGWVAGLAMTGGIAVVLVIAVRSPLATRLLNGATLLDRLAIWRATLLLWRDGPLLGTGPGGFPWRYPAFLPVQPLDGPLDSALQHPHNVWLEFASIYGIAGLAWLAALLVILWRHTRHVAAQSDWLALGLVAALGAGLAHAQVDAFAALPDLVGWLWIVLGLLSNGLALPTLQNEKSPYLAKLSEIRATIAK